MIINRIRLGGRMACIFGIQPNNGLEQENNTIRFGLLRSLKIILYQELQILIYLVSIPIIFDIDYLQIIP